MLVHPTRALVNYFYGVFIHSEVAKIKEGRKAKHKQIWKLIIRSRIQFVKETVKINYEKKDCFVEFVSIIHFSTCHFCGPCSISRLLILKDRFGTVSLLA